MQIGNISGQYGNEWSIGQSPTTPTPVVQGGTGGQEPSGQAFVGKIPQSFESKALVGQMKEAYDEKALKRMGIVECATCASRKYQDGSNDPGVSFKAPTHVSPEQSGSAVMAHEQEHVTREQSKAKQEGGEVIAQSVSIFTATCPECGRSYTSGGVTRTTVRYSQKQEDNALKGKLLDLKL